MDVIAIDCGTSFVKGAYYLCDKMVTTVRKAVPYIKEFDILKPQYIKEIYQVVVEIIDELEQGRPFCLCISNEMHGFVLTDEVGNPYTDYISWKREFGELIIDGNSAVKFLSSQEYQIEIKKTGMPLRNGLPSVNLLYLSLRGDVHEKSRFYTLGDYILNKITNKDVGIHITNAAATGLFDLDKKCWNSELLNLTCGSKITFPEIREASIPFHYKGKDCIAIQAVGDQQIALLGAGIKRTEQLSFNIGTGAQVSSIIMNPDFGMHYQIRPYFNNLYLKTVPHIPAGRALDVYFRFAESVLKVLDISYTTEELWKVLLSQKIEGENSLHCDMSFFDNVITNYSTGSISGINEENLSISNIFASAYETISQNCIKATQLLNLENSEIKELVFTGGVASRTARIREKIKAMFPNVFNVRVVENETLTGLKNYADNVMEREKND